MRSHVSAVLVALGVALPLNAAGAAQAPAPKSDAQPRASAKTASAATTAKTWTTPRTPWGDPDLQGLWPSIDMQGTPYERPADLAGRTVLNDDEFGVRQTARERQVEADAEQYVVDPPRRGGGTGPPSHWGEHGTADCHGSQHLLLRLS